MPDLGPGRGIERPVWPWVTAGVLAIALVGLVWWAASQPPAAAGSRLPTRAGAGGPAVGSSADAAAELPARVDLAGRSWRKSGSPVRLDLAGLRRLPATVQGRPIFVQADEPEPDEIYVGLGNDTYQRYLRLPAEGRPQ